MVFLDVKDKTKEAQTQTLSEFVLLLSYLTNNNGADSQLYTISSIQLSHAIENRLENNPCLTSNVKDAPSSLNFLPSPLLYIRLNALLLETSFHSTYSPWVKYKHSGEFFYIERKLRNAYDKTD